MKMNKAERREYIRKRADEMARSGKYNDWHHIEIALRGEGLDEARQVLDSQFLRKELNELCRRAQGKDD